MNMQGYRTLVEEKETLPLSELYVTWPTTVFLDSLRHCGGSCAAIRPLRCICAVCSTEVGALTDLGRQPFDQIFNFVFF